MISRSYENTLIFLGKSVEILSIFSGKEGKDAMVELKRKEYREYKKQIWF